jgi:hypothetical protein
LPFKKIIKVSNLPRSIFRKFLIIRNRRKNHQVPIGPGSKLGPLLKGIFGAVPVLTLAKATVATVPSLAGAALPPHTCSLILMIYESLRGVTICDRGGRLALFREIMSGPEFFA